MLQDCIAVFKKYKQIMKYEPTSPGEEYLFKVPESINDVTRNLTEVKMGNTWMDYVKSLIFGMAGGHGEAKEKKDL